MVRIFCCNIDTAEVAETLALRSEPAPRASVSFSQLLCASVVTFDRAVEVVLFDKVMAVYKHSGDIFLYIIGAPEENELILSSVLSCLEESLQTLFNSDAVESAQLDKRTLIENLDMLLLTVDEIIDEGFVPVSPLHASIFVLCPTAFSLAKHSFDCSLVSSRSPLFVFSALFSRLTRSKSRSACR